MRDFSETANLREEILTSIPNAFSIKVSQKDLADNFSLLEENLKAEDKNKAEDILSSVAGLFCQDHSWSFTQDVESEIMNLTECTIDVDYVGVIAKIHPIPLVNLVAFDDGENLSHPLRLDHESDIFSFLTFWHFAIVRDVIDPSGHHYREMKVLLSCKDVTSSLAKGTSFLPKWKRQQFLYVPSKGALPDAFHVSIGDKNNSKNVQERLLAKRKVFDISMIVAKYSINFLFYYH